MMDIFEKLAAEFPREAVHWRAQTLSQSGEKALALAYIDARDVMDRLDQVCTPAGWRNSYVETPKGRMIGTIEIFIDGQWIAKSDGAGDTDVEGEKGGISDALKRAAVLWGIGRYLYRLPSVWVPCTFNERNGKKYWKAWNGSPWDHVSKPNVSPIGKGLITDDDANCATIITLAQAAGVLIQTICEKYNVSELAELSKAQMTATINKLKLNIEKKTKEAA